MITLQHGTTLHRAQSILESGPNPSFVEPGSQQLPPAEGFSTIIRGTLNCGTGMPDSVARSKDRLFPTEGGPVILEIDVPEQMLAVFMADAVFALIAAGGELRFESGPVLDALLAEWHSLVKRIVLL